jgi:multidrug efflux system outer membrane protein
VRNRQLRGVSAILCLAILCGGAAGARAEQTSYDLTLDEALAMGRKANRSLVADRARLAQAQANLDLAWTTLFPTVAAQGKYTRNNIDFKFPDVTGKTLTVQPKNQLDGVISFTAPLVVPAAYVGLEAGDYSFHAAEAQFETSLATVLLGVAQAFYAAAIADEVVSARLSNIDVARVTLENARTRFENGSVTKVDVDRAELALVSAEQSAREARFSQSQAYRALATLIQSDRNFKVVPAVAAAVEEAGSLESALHLRPEFRALELTTKSADAQRRAQAWRWAPSLSAFGNLRAFNYDNFAGDHHAWAVGLQLDWVLYDGGVRDAQRHAASAQAQEAAALAAVLRDTIRDDLANGHGLLETKRHAQRAAERSVALAIETLDLVRTQYEAGHSAQIDLLQAQDGLVAAKEALAQAHFEVAVADLTLRRAAGSFPGP